MRATEARFGVFDVETTGLDTASDRIVEFGSAVFLGGAPLANGSQIIDPEAKIPEAASAVHGITDDKVVGRPKLADIAHKIESMLTSSDFLVGYNCLRFDVPLIQSDMTRVLGREFVIDTGRVVDVMVHVSWLLRGLRKRTQEKVAEHLGVVVGGRLHSAATDSLLTGLILLNMISRDMLPDDVDEIIGLQAERSRVVDKEYSRWSYWLYEDRDSGELVMGAGKACGTPLSGVRKSLLSYYLSLPDVPEEARYEMRAAVDGVYRERDLVPEDKNGPGRVAGWGGWRIDDVKNVSDKKTH